MDFSGSYIFVELMLVAAKMNLLYSDGRGSEVVWLIHFKAQCSF